MAGSLEETRDWIRLAEQALTRAFADRQSADYTPRWQATKMKA